MGVMMRRTAWILLLVLGVTSRWAGPPLQVLRAEEPTSNLRRPIFTAVLASANRVVDDIGIVVQATQDADNQSRLAEALAGFEKLELVRRDAPIGLFAFLQPGLVPRPVAVTFLPIDDIGVLQKFLSLEGWTPRKDPNRAGRYELVGPDRSTYVLFRGGYALVSEDADILNDEMPDPIAATRSLCSRYDAALSIDLFAVPAGMKTVLLEGFRASAEAELQQRDNEPDLQYRLRRANGLSTLEFLEQVFTQGESLIQGVSLSRESSTAVVEVELNATADSTLARYLHDIGSKPGRFAHLARPELPLSAALSWQMAEREKKALLELLKVAEQALGQALAGRQVPDNPESPAPLQDESAQRLVAPLIATAEKGHLDLFLQFVGEGLGHYVLVAGVHLVDADAFGTALSETLGRLQIDQLELNHDHYQGVALHRLRRPREAVPAQEQRIYGEDSDVYLGAGRNAFWFAVGGRDALAVLKQTMDAAAAPPEQPLDRSDMPLQFHLNVNHWLGVGDNGGNSPRQVRRRTLRQLAEEAFSTGGGRLRIDIRPTDTGARLRVQADEGLLRLLGLGISRRLVENQPNPQPPAPDGSPR